MKKIIVLIYSLLTLLRRIRTRRLPAGVIRQRNLIRFRRMAARVRKKCPYYRRIIEEQNIDIKRCSPADFPVLTKEILMANYDDILTDKRLSKKKIEEFLSLSTDPAEMMDHRYVVIHTSGTSGHRGLFVYSHADWGCSLAYGLESSRLKGKIPVPILFYGAMGGHFAGATMLSATKSTLVNRFYKIKELDINASREEVVRVLNTHQPQVIYGYPSAMAILLEYDRSEKLNISPRAFKLSGEVLSLELKKDLEQRFPGCRVENVYACSEHIILGFEAPGTDRMYIMEDDFIIEPTDNTLLVTNLLNKTLPLIRYEMNDRVVLRENPGPDLPFRQMEKIYGRNENPAGFINREGKKDFINPHVINEIFAPGLKRHQMKITGQSSFDFFISVEEGVSDEEKIRQRENLEHILKEILKKKHMENVTFRILETESFYIDPRSKKFKLIYSEQ